MRFIRRSEIVFLTYWTAPGISLSMSILWRHSFTRFFTSKQLSLRTVSIPIKRETQNQKGIQTELMETNRIHTITWKSHGKVESLAHLWCPFCQICLGLSSIDQHTSSYWSIDMDSKPSQTQVWLAVKQTDHTSMMRKRRPCKEGTNK